FCLLQIRICRHAAMAIPAFEFEHRIIQCVEAGKRDKLEFVTHRAQLALESGDGRAIEFALPIEGRRTIVGEQFVWELLTHTLSKMPRFVEVRRAGFAP